MKVFVQCLAQNSHTPHCHSCPVGFTISVNTLAETETFSELSPCAYPPTNRAAPWGLRQLASETPLMGTCECQWTGQWFTERSASGWFGAKIGQDHLALSSPQFPTLKNGREKRKKRKEIRRERGKEKKINKRQGQCFWNPKGSRKHLPWSLCYFPCHESSSAEHFAGGSVFLYKQVCKPQGRRDDLPGTVWLSESWLIQLAGTSPPAVTPASNQRAPPGLIPSGSCCLSQMKLAKDSRQSTENFLPSFIGLNPCNSAGPSLAI